jgi:hypothetical protein
MLNDNIGLLADASPGVILFEKQNVAIIEFQENNAHKPNGSHESCARDMLIF